MKNQEIELYRWSFCGVRVEVTAQCRRRVHSREKDRSILTPVRPSLRKLENMGSSEKKGFKHATYMAIKRHYIYYYMCICNIKRLRSNERRDEFLRVPLDFPRCRPSAGSISIYLPLFSLLSCFCCFFDRLSFKKLNFTKR